MTAIKLAMSAKSCAMDNCGVKNKTGAVCGPSLLNICRLKLCSIYFILNRKTYAENYLNAKHKD